MKYLWWILLVLWMGFIFFFSSQTGQESSSVSGVISDTVIPVFGEVLTNSSVEFIIRKCAHMLEYFVLGVLVVLAFQKQKQLNSVWICLLFCMLYACSDEFHQLWVNGRSGQLQDVLIDTIGALVGISLSWKLKKR